MFSKFCFQLGMCHGLTFLFFAEKLIKRLWLSTEATCQDVANSLRIEPRGRFQHIDFMGVLLPIEMQFSQKLII